MTNEIVYTKINEMKYEFRVKFEGNDRIVFVNIRLPDISIGVSQDMAENLINKLLSQKYMRHSFQSATLWGVGLTKKMEIILKDAVYFDEAVSMGKSVGLELDVFDYCEVGVKAKRYVITYVSKKTF